MLQKSIESLFNVDYDPHPSNMRKREYVRVIVRLDQRILISLKNDTSSYWSSSEFFYTNRCGKKIANWCMSLECFWVIQLFVTSKIRCHRRVRSTLNVQSSYLLTSCLVWLWEITFNPDKSAYIWHFWPNLNH